MPYLTRIILDPASPRTINDLSSLYAMHRTVMRAFRGPRSQERVLYRLDYDRHFENPCLLVQSTQPGDWSYLYKANGYLISDTRDGQLNPAQTFFELTSSFGDILFFRLRANPTFRRGHRRLAYLRRQDQLLWLTRQGINGGFELLRVSLMQEGFMWARKRIQGVTHNLCFGSVLFSGLLRVIVPEALAEVVEGGVGSGKAFGFGLLSLARPQWLG